MTTMLEDVEVLAYDPETGFHDLSPNEELCAILDVLVEDRGEMYRYPWAVERFMEGPKWPQDLVGHTIDPRYDGEEEGCHYVDHPKGDVYSYSCVVGGIVAKVAPGKLQALCMYDNTSSASTALTYMPERFNTPEISMILEDLQTRQDQGWPWGSAVRIAKRELRARVRL